MPDMATELRAGTAGEIELGAVFLSLRCIAGSLQVEAFSYHRILPCVRLNFVYPALIPSSVVYPKRRCTYQV